MKLITELTTAEIVNAYNLLANTPVRKFRDRQTAESKLWGVCAANEEKLLEALVESEANPEVITRLKKLVDGKKPKEAPQPSVAQPVAKPKEAPAEAQEGAQEAPAESGKTKILVKKDDLLTMELIRTLTREDVESGWVCSEQMIKADKGMGSRFLLNSMRRLGESGVVEFDDQSTKDEVDLWVRLKDDVQAVCKKRELDGPKQEKVKAAGSRNVLDRNSVIVVLVASNPRREGTWGFKSFNLYKPGMTIKEYMEAGGRSNDLRWDIDHNYIAIQPAE
jgi:hypothetical protein